MSTALIVIKNKSENTEPELTLEQREEQNSLDAYYQWKAKGENQMFHVVSPCSGF